MGISYAMSKVMDSPLSNVKCREVQKSRYSRRTGGGLKSKDLTFLIIVNEAVLCSIQADRVSPRWSDRVGMEEYR